MRCQYTSVIARMAPAWMPTLNRSERVPSQCSAISRCPVDEIGRNSVMPSMMPRMTTRKKSCMGAALQAKSCASVRGHGGVAQRPRRHRQMIRRRSWSGFDLQVDMAFRAFVLRCRHSGKGRNDNTAGPFRETGGIAFVCTMLAQAGRSSAACHAPGGIAGGYAAAFDERSHHQGTKNGDQRPAALYTYRHIPSLADPRASDRAIHRRLDD